MINPSYMNQITIAISLQIITYFFQILQHATVYYVFKVVRSGRVVCKGLEESVSTRWKVLCTNVLFVRSSEALWGEHYVQSGR